MQTKRPLKRRKRKRLPDKPDTDYFKSTYEPVVPRLILISRPYDIARRFKIGIDTVLDTLRREFPKLSFGERTKLSDQVIARIEPHANTKSFWKKRSVIPQVEIPEKKVVSNSNKPIKKPKKKHRKGGSVKAVSVPIGGQPGFKIKHQYR